MGMKADGYRGWACVFGDMIISSRLAPTPSDAIRMFLGVASECPKEPLAPSQQSRWAEFQKRGFRVAKAKIVLITDEGGEPIRTERNSHESR